jgi:Transposase
MAQRLSNQQRAPHDRIAVLMRSVIGIAGFMLAIISPTIASAATIEEVAHCRAIPQLAERLNCFKSLKPGPRAKTEDAAQGPVACREAAISQQSYCRWRKEYGGLEVDQAKRMKELERENVRLKRLVADLSLEKQILNGAINTTQSAHTHRSDIGRRNRKYPQGRYPT